VVSTEKNIGFTSPRNGLVKEKQMVLSLEQVNPCFAVDVATNPMKQDLEF
jgi:hypothetical protein